MLREKENFLLPNSQPPFTNFSECPLVDAFVNNKKILPVEIIHSLEHCKHLG